MSSQSTGIPLATVLAPASHYLAVTCVVIVGNVLDDLRQVCLVLYAAPPVVALTHVRDVQHVIPDIVLNLHPASSEHVVRLVTPAHHACRELAGLAVEVPAVVSEVRFHAIRHVIVYVETLPPHNATS